MEREEPDICSHVSFGFQSLHLSSQEITDALGITPTKTITKGTLMRSPPLGKKWKDWDKITEAAKIARMKVSYRVQSVTVWNLYSDKLGNFTNVNQHIEVLLNLLEPKRERLEAIRPQCERFQIWLKTKPTDYDMSVAIDAQLFARLIRLGDDLTVYSEIP